MTNKINEYLNLIMNTPFPYREYSGVILKKDFFALTETNLTTTNYGLKIIEHFHKSIWRCNRKGFKSPIDAWQDPLLLYKVIENRLKYLKTDFLTPYQIRSGFSHSGKAPKVSIFKPAYAKYLIQKYLNDYNEVFDPCAGFSGRMLGTAVLGKHYIGQDINSITIKEAKAIKDFLSLDAELYIKDSLYDTGNYECLFACPPYGDKETWHQDIEVLSADEWIDICLKNYNCKTYLFVVDKTEKYSKYIVETLENKSHFGCNTEKIVLIKK